MIISVNWLKKYTDIDMPIDELATLIGARLVEIEKIVDLGAKYKDVLVARVMSSEKHADSDHLTVVKLDDGGKARQVERDENGYVQVVCGAPNVREGLLVAWLPPGSLVPETYGTNEPFVLDARKLRGVLSSGMIASAKELALFDEHEGILELDKEDLVPGTSFAKAYGLDDYLLDIENKSLTHRPDCFGIVGFAREVAAIQGKPFTTPDWLRDLTPVITPQNDQVAAPFITIDSPELSDRYQAIVLQGVDSKVGSPLQLQTYLTRVGVRPISAVVDVTNYLMMLTGQPLHAFDYDKLVAVGEGKVDIHVRGGRENETLQLLDGRTITLTADDIVVANGDVAVSLGGAMGGANTEIDENTKTIFLESAAFNLYNLRATQMRHGIFSEAMTRNTKGQPAALTAPVLTQATAMLGEFSGATVASEIAEAYPRRAEAPTLHISAEQVNETLGSYLTIEDMLETLRFVEFSAEMTCEDDSKSEGTLHVKVPYWRNDIHINEDIIEEIGRLNGFDSIEPILPPRDFTATRPTEFDQLRARLRDILARAGANELLTYSFVHGDLLKNAGQDPQNSYRLTNSLSPSLQYYRQTLTPSLLAHIHSNIKQGYDDVALFELNKVHPKQHGLTDEGVPGEVDMLAMVVASKKPRAAGAAYYQAKRFLDFLGAQLGLTFRYEQLKDDPGYPVTAPFQPFRSALVTEATSGVFIGIIGEYKSSLARAFKLPQYVAGFELGTQDILEAVQKLTPSYTAPSRFPGTERDICFQVAVAIPYSQIAELVAQKLAQQELETTIEPVDIYQASDSEVKNITVRIKLTSHTKTLTSDEATAIVNDVATYVGERTGATII